MDALPQLAVLGLLTGTVTAGVIVLFRELIALLANIFLRGHPEGAFLRLSWEHRVILPFIGSFLLIIIVLGIRKKFRPVGIVHVIERLDWHQGRLNFGNFLHQFFAGAIAIASGHSIGREGPAVHLGAAAGSLLGQGMRLPNNSLRILVACGTASAISAAFNTPLAGVIFALEVLLVEYTVASFLPVMLASVSAAGIIQFLYGNDPAFFVPYISVDLVDELPLVILIGFMMGFVSTLYCRLIIFFNKRTASFSPYTKLLLAAAITGLLAIPAPDIMGVGYDTITELMIGENIPVLLFTLLVCKLLATSASVGMGVPGGLIGPTLFLGAVGGTLTETMVSHIPAIASNSPAFHSMIGMSAMLGAVLQAPLTALVTVVELTRNSNLLFPALLAIVIAALTSNLLLRQHGIFELILDCWGYNRVQNPVHKALSQMGISNLVNESCVILERKQSKATLQNQLRKQPEWLLVTDEGRTKAIMPAIALGQYFAPEKDAPDEKDSSIDLLDIPSRRYDIGALSNRASVYEAWELMQSKGVEALYITKQTRKQDTQIIGIVTKASLQRYYRV
ncbi:chloride channel protein [Sansalvadorimonas verongulae]|uniref:chloride channel protein n=1 Tax=Sansalvadorimonas verongulae TaxID=2172824 RepID=UPI002E378933|nr:chloride channel protein [Sansalvadorimonas verongulae]